MLSGGDDVRGGPGDDFVTGSRLLDGGDGNDTPAQDRRHGGRHASPAGRATTACSPTTACRTSCSAAPARTSSATPTLRPKRRDLRGRQGRHAQVAAGEGAGDGLRTPQGRSRPGRDGRLAVWMKCSEPKCAVTVRLVSVSSRGLDDYAVFRKPPLLRLVVGEKAKLVHLKLNAAQRRATEPERRRLGRGRGRDHPAAGQGREDAHRRAVLPACRPVRRTVATVSSKPSRSITSGS